MADPIIPPRRDQVLTEGGRGLIRFLEYLERVASNINATPLEIEEQIFALEGAVQKIGSVKAELESQINDLTNTISRAAAENEELQKQLSNEANLLPVLGNIQSQLSELKARIDDLEQQN